MRYVRFSFLANFVARELIKYILQVMRAAGLGVVVEVGPGSTFEVGDRVTGSWGAFIVFVF